eukprot:10624830-Prorocentrum_lima.AAC.1
MARLSPVLKLPLHSSFMPWVLAGSNTSTTFGSHWRRGRSSYAIPSPRPPPGKSSRPRRRHVQWP